MADDAPNPVQNLEERFMFLEKQVEDLDCAVVDVNGDVGALRREIAALRASLQQLTQRVDAPADADEDTLGGASDMDGQ